jgi:ABC-type molybdenum transport system ATPase subunit/photorepair protein PhrA
LLADPELLILDEPFARLEKHPAMPFGALSRDHECREQVDS